MREIIDHYGTQVADRRSSEPMIRAIMRDPRVDLAEVLSWVKLPQLRQLSEMFRLDVRGREKEGFVEALSEHIRADFGNDEDVDGEEEESATPSSLASKNRSVPVRRVEDEAPETSSPAPKVRVASTKRADDEPFDVFIVHGHDDAMRGEIKQFLSDLDLSCVVLQDAPDKGNTVLEKLERYANLAKYAIVLLSPDDEGYSRRDGATKARARARQNVVLELGWMIGKLGRTRVTVLHQGNVELPSDINGLLYTEYDAKHKDAALLKLAKQLRHAGFTIDLNRVV